ncbi:type II secretory pathway, component PulD [Horticoccus sp. 23ND18S-11]|uniref:type II secretory pathway, component PulD n=1 Tax=Horticoccus sp. 23ND18S-11 TaxID=3391832 RepID=UPI0039C8C486
MNTRPLLASVLVVLAVAFPGAAMPLRAAPAPSQTDAKIRLMSDALRARDAGDLAGAQKALAQLATLSPNDPAVQKLRAEIEAQAVAQQSALAERAAAQQAALAAPAPVAAAPVSRPPATTTGGPAMIDVRIPEPGQTPPPVTPGTPSAAEVEADAIARAESARIAQLVSTGQTQLATARAQLRAGQPDDAIAMVDAAIAALPANALTQKLVADLNKEKASALLERAQSALKRGDSATARTALAAHAQLAPSSTRAQSIERQIARAEAKPVNAAVDPGFVADRAATAQLIAKGRAQYVAGDLDGAQGTFRAIEAQEPDNTVAKGFLLRIAEEKTETGALNREKTRAQLLEEVAKSWQRPGIYQERVREPSAVEAAAPLVQKLNSIIIPEFVYSKASLRDIVNILGEISATYDPSNSSPKGVNVALIDPTDKNPTVTIALRGMSLKRVLDLVTEQVSYQYEVQSDAVIVRPGGETSTLETQFFPVTRATVLRMSGMSSSAGGAAGAGRDPYAAGGAGAEPTASGGEASAMRAFLTQAGVSFSVEGSSLAYDGSAIIVTQTARNNERIRNILARYNDVRQVEIEAKFMEVQEGALEELGVTWNLSRRGVPRVNPATGAPVLDSNGRQIFDPQELYTSAGINRSLVGAFPSTSNANALVIKDPAITTSDTDPNQTTGQLRVPVAPTNIPGAVQLAATANALANIVGFVGEFDVSAAVRALSQKQGTDLLSSPKLTVLSGNPANITVAQELRYPQSYGEIQSQVGTGAVAGGAAGVTITAGTPQEFTSRNVGVELKVTPTVEEDDYSISLDLNPKVTEFEGFVEYGGPSVAISGTTTVTVPPGFYQPIFSVRDISTKVTIWDGATLVMGGLTREEVKKVNDKVPFFGDLPLVGRLFRSKGESAQKRNLLIFVTANLVSPGGSPKKQSLKNTPANSLFQNPTIVTPASAEPRTRSGAK